MRRAVTPLLMAAAVLVVPAAQAANGGAPLVLEQTIPLERVSGRIDHMAFDAGRRRLFVAELGNGTVDVIDVNSGRIVRRLAGFREPQGVGYAPAADVLAVANATDGTVRLFRGEDFRPTGTISLGSDADNVRIGGDGNTFVVGYGEGGLAILDAARASVLNRISLPDHPEGFQIDPASRRAFVNLPDAHRIAVVDLDAAKQVTAWRLPGLEANFPMALADQDKAVIVVFRSPAKLVVLGAEDGNLRVTLDTCGDADDVFVDRKRQRLYVSCGEGFVDVFGRTPDGYRRVGRIETKGGARTSLFVPSIDRLFVAARAGLFGYGLGTAAILVLRPQD